MREVFTLKRSFRSLGLYALAVGWLLAGAVGAGSAPASGTGEEDGGYISGTVVFEGKWMPMAAALTVGGEDYVLPDGHFQIPLSEGVHEFTVSTLLGEVDGVIVHDPGLVHPDNETELMSLWAEQTGRSERPLDELSELEMLLYGLTWIAAFEGENVVGANGRHDSTIYFPEFDGWSRTDFNRLLTSFGNTDATMRWHSFSEIPVWIDGSGHTEAAAMQAFREWEDASAGAVTFVRSPRNVAEAEGIVVLFQSSGEITAQGGEGAAGYCRPRQVDGEIRSGVVGIGRGYAEPLLLLKHEIGHCLGFGHSPHAEDVMHASSGLKDRPITEREANMVRLLYSIPPGTPR